MRTQHDDGAGTRSCDCAQDDATVTPNDGIADAQDDTTAHAAPTQDAVPQGDSQTPNQCHAVLSEAMRLRAGQVPSQDPPNVYTPQRCALDRLNPIARLVFAVLLAVPVLITLDWVSAAVMLSLELLVFTGAGAGLARMLLSLWPVAVIGLIAAVSMALYGRPGGATYLHWWLIDVSQRSLLLALAVFLRILSLALAAMVLIGRVDPTLMADALAQIAHLPARFVLGTLAGVRTTALIGADWRALGLARRARGLGDHGWLRRVASMAFALLVIAIRRGTDLATAMEVRGFNTANAARRTWARPSKLGPADAFGLVITSIVVAASVMSAIWAGTFWLVWTGVPS